MDSLRLTYPAQQQGQHLLVETDPPNLSRWLSSLPYGDMGRAVPEVSRAIASLNRSAIAHGLREELVNLFDRSYAQIFAAYRPTALHLTNDDTRRKEHNNLHQLTREMAFAHKILADEELKKKKLWGKNKALARGINLSIHYLGLLLMEHYESYSPIPIYLWRECNNLYSYAQKKQLESIETSNVDELQCMPTIEGTYARVCLMSLANPYHLSLGEHWQIYHYLSHWVHLVEFSDDDDDFQQDKCFVIELTGQEKPNYSSQYPDIEEHENICFMLTHELVRQLDYHQALITQQREMPSGFYVGLDSEAAKTLTEHMSLHWAAKVERASQRYPVLTKIDVVWGVAGIHKLLTQHVEMPNSTHWELPQLENFLSEEQSLPLSWDASNVSSNGVGICNSKNIAHRLKVGELVIIREYIDNKPSFRWRVAICRWLFGDDNQGTRAGLEFIDGNLTPARLQSKTARSKSTGQPALLLKNVDENPNIIATLGTYHDNRSFLLSYDQQHEDIKLRTRSLVTPCVEQFTYQCYEVIEVDESEENDESMSEGPIPWTSLPNQASEEQKDEQDAPAENNEINLDSVRLPGDH